MFFINVDVFSITIGSSYGVPSFVPKSDICYGLIIRELGGIV